MTTTTKAVAWIGAIFATISVATLILIVTAMMSTGQKKAEVQRQAQETWKQAATQDLSKLRDASKDYMKQVDLNQVFASPSPNK
jgi:hypothetical protein